eukprot:CAMPEP_0113700572 /NCGR_PEP_ID=MMETSP0038_2-20120614/24047_1 /TAXON_ID=2898 /ORGANISM="Cryptomonas paramecium" /LENGTH=366 /DNA_ID=CAMNT_0000624275 /DNA_START=8 /DNA_END=1104 /DNA_ORIENTATION=+ /assembly_acc=CAM_ASM_000170
MAEEHARWKQYEYSLNSNLVLTSDRKARGGDNEPSGEAESLASKKLHRMGDKVLFSKPAALVEKKEKIDKRRLERAQKDAVRKKSKVGTSALADAVIELGSYRPKTETSRLAYEQLLNFLVTFMGEQPNDVLRGAADEVLSVLKNDNLQGAAKQKQCEQLLSAMSADRFAELVQISNRISDFSSQDTEGAAGEAMDENLGVSVVFDEDENSEEDDLDELRDEGDDDDEEGVDDKDVERTVIGLREAADDMGEAEEDADYIDPLSIDAYWLQRNIKEKCTMSDDNDAVKMANEVLAILGHADERDVENRLVVLLDYDKFDFIKALLKNRHAIVFCTQLGQAQKEEDKAAIQEEMRKTAEGRSILEAL